ncbi:uncharacterized protein LOC127724314 [Mytilus californianus]|uniref:uncharacterized protein LOC127724314 n=1 Tax=Mytilus californianus TaxID=6549 RepID=UPI002247BA6C|nr:uncharacterized protein LOC127724314 [Mytilus californianus]
MFVFRLFSLSLSVITTLTSSVGSQSESLLTCSKFHFEENVLEKLVRFEHKMELFEEKMKMMQSSMSSKLEIMNKIEKATETLTETMLDKQLQFQTRINDSYQEIVDNFKMQSNNETKLYGEKMNTLLDSLSLNSQEINETEKERERKIESMQRDLHEEQKRVKISYDVIVENFKIHSNKTLQELILQHETEFKEMMAKRETVAFSAYRPSPQTLSSGEKVIFDGVWTNVGNGYEPSTGVFKAPHPGLYHMTAVVMSYSGTSLGLDLYHNNLEITRSYLSGDGYKTGIFDVVLNLQKGDKVHIESSGTYTIYSNHHKFITYSGYRIT